MSADALLLQGNPAFGPLPSERDEMGPVRNTGPQVRTGQSGGSVVNGGNGLGIDIAAGGDGDESIDEGSTMDLDG